MNIEQARSIPVPEFLEKMNAPVQKQKGHEWWYLSPLRNEKTASLKVDLIKNFWFDFGEGKGGDGIKLVRAFLEANNRSSSVSDALSWIRNTSGNGSVITVPSYDTKCVNEQDDGNLQLKSISPIRH